MFYAFGMDYGSFPALYMLITSEIHKIRTAMYFMSKITGMS